MTNKRKGSWSCLLDPLDHHPHVTRYNVDKNTLVKTNHDLMVYRCRLNCLSIKMRYNVGIAFI